MPPEKCSNDVQHLSTIYVRGWKPILILRDAVARYPGRAGVALPRDRAVAVAGIPRGGIIQSQSL